MITNILCATNSFTASIPRKVEALFHKGVPVKLNNFTDETLGVSFQSSLQNFLTTFLRTQFTDIVHITTFYKREVFTNCFSYIWIKNVNS